jgi:hypothetical protein
MSPSRRSQFQSQPALPHHGILRNVSSQSVARIESIRYCVVSTPFYLRSHGPPTTVHGVWRFLLDCGTLSRTPTIALATRRRPGPSFHPDSSSFAELSARLQQLRWRLVVAQVRPFILTNLNIRRNPNKQSRTKTRLDLGMRSRKLVSTRS